MFGWVGGDEHDLALFGQNEEQTGIFEEKDLAFAVTAAFPFAVARFQVDAGEKAAIIAVSVTLVSDEIGEVRFELARGPKFFGGVLTVGFLKADGAGAHVHSGGQKNGVSPEDVRLQGAVLRNFPLVF